MAQALLGHVQRYLGVEHAHVEREQAVHVLGEEGDVMHTIYASPGTFTDGFAPAIGVTAALSLVGALAGIALPGRRAAPDVGRGPTTPALGAEGAS
jgi:hypothetical protein